MDLRNLPREERVCVNCKHYRKSLNPLAWLAYFFGDTDMHRCTLEGKQESLNTITGKVTVKIQDESCRIQQSYNGKCNDRNSRWEPSERWKKKKENLFKLLKT